MIKWKDILKSNQINIGSTTLDTRNLPEEDDDKDCCEEAHAAWINLSKDVLEEIKEYATKNSIDFWSKVEENFPLEESCNNPDDFGDFLLYQLHIAETYYDKYRNPGSLLPHFYPPRIKEILDNWHSCLENKRGEIYDT